MPSPRGLRRHGLVGKGWKLNLAGSEPRAALQSWADQAGPESWARGKCRMVSGVVTSFLSGRRGPSGPSR